MRTFWTTCGQFGRLWGTADAWQRSGLHEGARIEPAPGDVIFLFTSVRVFLTQRGCRTLLASPRGATRAIWAHLEAISAMLLPNRALCMRRIQGQNPPPHPCVHLFWTACDLFGSLRGITDSRLRLSQHKGAHVVATPRYEAVDNGFLVCAINVFITKQGR